MSNTRKPLLDKLVKAQSDLRNFIDQGTVLQDPEACQLANQVHGEITTQLMNLEHMAAYSPEETAYVSHIVGHNLSVLKLLSPQLRMIALDCMVTITTPDFVVWLNKQHHRTLAEDAPEDSYHSSHAAIQRAIQRAVDDGPTYPDTDDAPVTHGDPPTLEPGHPARHRDPESMHVQQIIDNLPNRKRGIPSMPI